MAEEILLEARQLIHPTWASTRFGGGISLHVRQGEAVALLGSRGTGKTALLKMMYGGTPVQQGDIFVLGLNVKFNAKGVRAQVGVVTEENLLDPELTALENLHIFCRYHGQTFKQYNARCMEILRAFRLEDLVDCSIQDLSKNQKRRLLIARSLINSPRLLFLDEPTCGLDIESKQEIWLHLRKLNTLGVSLVVATRDCQEAETLCRRTVLIEAGQVLADGTPEELIKTHIGREIVEFSVSPSDLEYFLERVKTVYDYQIYQGRIRLFIRAEQDGQQALKTLASDHLVLRKPTLSDVYLKLSGVELVVT